MAGPRCNDCGKFVSLEMSDPEVEIELDGTTIRAQMRIARTCADCGTEMKTADLTAEVEVPELQAHEGVEHSLEVENNDPKAIEEGGSRYAKSYFGASVDYTVRCSCQEAPVAEGTLSDKIAASAMDEV